MHNLEWLAYIGALISWWGTARYIIGVLRDGTQPRLSSWIAWSTANSVLMIVALMNGNHMAANFNGLAALGNIGVILASCVKRAGERPDTPTDWICLAISGACLGTILLLPRLTVLDACLALCANAIATWPTIQHAWRRPHEETWQLFAANAGANLLGLVSVIMASGLALTNIAGPLAGMTGNLILVCITVGRKWLVRVVEEVEKDAHIVSQNLDPYAHTATCRYYVDGIHFHHPKPTSPTRLLKNTVNTVL